MQDTLSARRNGSAPSNHTLMKQMELKYMPPAQFGVSESKQGAPFGSKPKCSFIYVTNVK